MEHFYLLRIVIRQLKIKIKFFFINEWKLWEYVLNDIINYIIFILYCVSKNMSSSFEIEL